MKYSHGLISIGVAISAAVRSALRVGRVTGGGWWVVDGGGERRKGLGGLAVGGNLIKFDRSFWREPHSIVCPSTNSPV